MRKFFKPKKPQESKNLVVLPFDLDNFYAGDMIELDQFFYLASQRMQELEDEIQRLQDENFDLKREVDVLQCDLEEHYRPINPYTYNGVSQRDF